MAKRGTVRAMTMRRFLSVAGGVANPSHGSSGLVPAACANSASLTIPAKKAGGAASGTGGKIETFAPDDIHQVADLHKRVFPDSALSPPELATYFRQIFFENPWYDPAIPSLIYRGEGGKIFGFYGVVPRRMRLRGQPIRVALSTQFMVDPAFRNRLAAVELQREFFAGPQDLSLTDGANEASRKIWEALGGFTAFPYSVHWTRILEPGRFLLNRGKERGFPAALQLVFRPLCAGADLLATRLSGSPFHQVEQPLEEDPSGRTILQLLPKFPARGSLCPEYDQVSLSWLLEEAGRKLCHGRLRKLVVRNDLGLIAGWCLYYLNPDGVSQVLQIVATRDSVRRVLDHLFHDAWRSGSFAVSGRLDPELVSAVSREHCLFSLNGPWMLVHSKRPELREVIQRGDAFLTRLEGEWWMRFQGG
jgi:hypothetical protein